MARFLDETGLAYFWEKIKAFFQSHQQTIPEYTIEKKQTAEEGYTSSYVLKKDGTQVGATINIPKDYLVRSGEVKTVTVADEPYEGAAVGDKYIDFVVNTVDDSGNTSHIYIPVSDLCAAYNAGNGIQISGNNYISVKVNQNQSNGLGVGGEGLSLYVVTPSVNGAGGTNGAMTATDKEKLDGLPTNAKSLQTAVSDPTASGTSIEFVSNITQNENGEITPLKKTVRTMTASGQNHTSGLVPDPGSTAGTTRYLCENGTWSEPNGGSGGTSTPTDVQINGTSITSNNVANVQTEGVYNAVTNKIATMNDLPSTSGFALDSAVVHKTGDETVGGTKTFNNNVVLGTNANLVLSTAQDEGVYMEANTSSGGQQALTFANLDDDSAVRLENVATPINNTDAANKDYVDSKGDNNLVKLNGYSGQYGITPWSLCAFAVWQGGITSTMESLTTSGGSSGKPPVTSVSPTISFPIGCKIYYHPDSSFFAMTTAFTSKNFYATYDDVDARYTAVTGSSIILSSQSASTVYLRVMVDNGYWKPYYKSGETTEIIVTSNNLVSDNFYIYLGKTVGDTGYKLQLEDNNPLYYYDGTNLIDWATSQASDAAPSYTAGDGIDINDGVISCTPRPYMKEFLTTASFNSSSVYQRVWQNFVASSNLEVGAYKVTLQVHLYIVSNADNMMPAGCVVNAYMRSKATASSSYQYILGATETFSGGVLPETSIPTGRGIISKVLNVVGFMEITGDEDSGCFLEVGFTTNSSLNVLIGNSTPLDGSYAGLCSGNDFVLLEKIA